MIDNIQQQHEPLLCQTVNSNGRYYNQPKQHEPIRCQTLNSNDRQHNNNNMNHSSVKIEKVMVDKATTT
jgi:hypothetical protein